MAPKKVLVVLTSADKFTKKGDGKEVEHPTGWYLPEFAHPYDVLKPHAEIVVASPKGGVAPLDPSSVESFKEDSSSTNFLKNKKHVWENTTPLKQFLGKSSEYDALFYPGGHGPMFDLATDADSIALIEEFYKAGKPVAAVCHGPIVFADAKLDGKPLIRGKKVTGFTNAEEDQTQLSSSMPFLLEDKLIKSEGVFEKAAEPWAPYVVVDGLIITGQNPASAKGVGEKIVEAISK